MKNGYLTDYPVCPEIPLHLSTQWGLSEVRCFTVVAGRRERVGFDIPFAGAGSCF